MVRVYESVRARDLALKTYQEPNSCIFAGKTWSTVLPLCLLLPKARFSAALLATHETLHVLLAVSWNALGLSLGTLGPLVDALGTFIEARTPGNMCYWMRRCHRSSGWSSAHIRTRGHCTRTASSRECHEHEHTRHRYINHSYENHNLVGPNLGQRPDAAPWPAFTTDEQP